MRDLLFLCGLFVAAVAVGFLIHPLFSVLFLIAAKVVSIIWTSAVESYHAISHLKRKRRHIQTADGEQLEIMAAEDADEEIMSSGKTYG
jgi:hypothetical protein